MMMRCLSARSKALRCTQPLRAACREAREAREEDGTPRDSFLRPMVDLQGAKARLGFNAGRAAQEIEEEFDENRWESQEALKYAGVGPTLRLGSKLCSEARAVNLPHDR